MAVTDRSHRLLSWLARVAKLKSVPATCWYANSVVAVPALAQGRTGWGLPGVVDCRRLVSGTSAARKIRGGKGGCRSSRQ